MACVADASCSLPDEGLSAICMQWVANGAVHLRVVKLEAGTVLLDFSLQHLLSSNHIHLEYSVLILNVAYLMATPSTVSFNQFNQFTFSVLGTHQGSQQTVSALTDRSHDHMGVVMTAICAAKHLCPHYLVDDCFDGWILVKNDLQDSRTLAGRAVVYVSWPSAT